MMRKRMKMPNCRDCKFWYMKFHYKLIDSCSSLAIKTWYTSECEKAMKLSLFDTPCEYYEEWIPEYRITRFLKRKILMNERKK